MKNQRLITLSSRLAEKANKFIIAELKKYELSDIAPSHGDILSLLFDGNAYEMGEIAKRIHRTKPTVTVLIEKLEKSGYVERIKSDDDALFTRVSLTAKGFELKPLFETISERLNQCAYQGLTEAEAMLLEVLLEKAVVNFEKRE
ncbi:MarR family winged helix-turn-helix transcriptional regulator [Sulfurospirillum diekertiae]|uniref:MarR family transcriptional regulator n=1 Tax=Sulfurospirillum diekertiae TaxID=1854492 RepID=A0AA92IZ17_9BACT|nr:MarR family transcriptional regulator [Sulfurospirillum diekertiae]QIR76604.1 MarR family transcriptional regulator [Sulfurospirillum diekertiae]